MLVYIAYVAIGITILFELFECIKEITQTWKGSDSTKSKLGSSLFIALVTVMLIFLTVKFGVYGINKFLL